MVLLEVRNVSKGYPDRADGAGRSPEARLVVDNVSFEIRRGQTLGLVGESGSGKTTVARMVLGLIAPSGGEVRFDGQSITGASPPSLRKLRRRFQPVFQDPFAALNPRMTVAAILAEPFKIHQPERRAEAVRQEVRWLLNAVGLEESALLRYPHEFSGGQRQRINIARALALRPELLVLDEPVSALDVSVGAQIINLLRELQQSYQLTYLFISHSMPLVRYLATNIAVLRSGKLVEIGECETLCQAPQNSYTQSLLQATPELPLGHES